MGISIIIIFKKKKRNYVWVFACVCLCRGWMYAKPEPIVFPHDDQLVNQQ